MSLLEIVGAVSVALVLLGAILWGAGILKITATFEIDK